MTQEEFVEALRRECRDSAVSDCLQSYQAPSGRRPGAALMKLSEWYKTLSSEDQTYVAFAMRDAADATLFGVLSVIDGVRAIEPYGEKSEFKLSANRLGVESSLAPGPDFLHDILRANP